MDEQDTERTAPRQATGTTDGHEAAPVAPAAPPATVTGLVAVGTEDAPACSDGVCW
ncbi:hypothetical protein [Nocardiopsis sp. CC223A]|uniref:hypothetical protein n=1 Tax=Nocardiopsis sp. CC223A TaxID=3044051 RepID=UPI00278C3B7A|nr:hypothetical protein [Nocardiopsis sp. CC223A]